MKTIAVSQRVIIDPAHGQRHDCLDPRWHDFLKECGLIGAPVPNRRQLAEGHAEAVAAAGVLLTGGDNDGQRDAAEKKLIGWARGRGLPLLGVCHGMQMIQASFGVELRQVEGHAGRNHMISIDGGYVEVNSFHNKAARDTAPELEVWARAADGVVEAVRHVSEPILGIMWHPERVEGFNRRDLALFKDFFGSAC